MKQNQTIEKEKNYIPCENDWWSESKGDKGSITVIGIALIGPELILTCIATFQCVYAVLTQASGVKHRGWRILMYYW